jgi:aminocarboxymuconate-semialdehyde decarboxylase
VTQLGLAGVQIGSHVNEWTLSDPALFPVFKTAAELGAAIFVHPWDMMGSDLMKKYFLPWLVGMPAETSLAICSMLFGGIFERLPDLRVCFAHGGGAFPVSLGRVQHGFDVRPDLCASECLSCSCARRACARERGVVELPGPHADLSELLSWFTIDGPYVSFLLPH